MRALLARGDFRLLLAGQSLSMFGDWAMIVVLGIWAKVLTGSNAAAGLVFFCIAATGLVAPFGGVLVDRLPKKALMIATHFTLAGVICLLLLVHSRQQLWILFAVTIAYGFGGDIFAAARSAIFKSMLPDELLAEANGAYQSIRQGLRLVAPLAGAGIFATWGGHAMALVDAASFVVSAMTLVLVPFAEPPAADMERHFLRELTAGIRQINGVPILRQLTIGIAATMLVAGVSESLMFAVTGKGLHREASFVGVIATFQGIGSIGGGISAPIVMRALGDLRFAGLGVALFAIGDALWLVPSAPVVLAGTAVAGVGIVWAIVSLSTAYQLRSPHHVQGRVTTAANMLFSVPQTVSIAVGAILVTVVDYRLELAAMASGMLAAAGYMLTRPG